MRFGEGGRDRGWAKGVITCELRLHAAETDVDLRGVNARDHKDADQRKHQSQGRPVQALRQRPVEHAARRVLPLLHPPSRDWVRDEVVEVGALGI